MAFMAEYLSANSFRIIDNYVGEFMEGRRIRAYCGPSDTYRFGTVASSFFSNPYTLVYLDANSDPITSNLEYVEYGIIGKGADQSMPYHNHDGMIYSGGIIDINLGAQLPHGFPNRTDSILSIDTVAQTITLSPNSGSFSVYVKGIKFTYTSPQIVTIPSTSALYIISINNVGVMNISSTISGTNYVINSAPVATVYWNDTLKQAVTFSDERHTTVMSGGLHYYLHRVFHTRWINGLSLSDFQANQNGSNISHCQFSVSNGEFHDEDLIYPVVNNTPQALAPISYIPVFYKTGVNGIWARDTATNVAAKPYPTGRLAFNNYSGGSWIQTKLTNNYYVLSHIIAINVVNNPVIAIQGQTEYSTIEAAINASNMELYNLNTSGLPMVESVALGTVIFQTSEDYTNSYKARIVQTTGNLNYIDWRGNPGVLFGLATSHSSLTNLNGDDHTQYTRVDGLRPFTSTIGGVTPVAPNDLVTKSYVDPVVRPVVIGVDAYDKEIILSQTVNNIVVTIHHSTNAIISIKACDAGNVTIQPALGLIDNAVDIKITATNGHVRCVWDGNNWYTI